MFLLFLLLRIQSSIYARSAVASYYIKSELLKIKDIKNDSVYDGCISILDSEGTILVQGGIVYSLCQKVTIYTRYKGRGQWNVN